MAKLCRLVLGVLCVTALFAVEAQADCRYRCLGTYTTSSNGLASDWGMGSSCVAADADLDAHLWANADSICQSMGHIGACSLVKVVTEPCYFNTGINMYQTDGYANFKCTIEICIDPIDPLR